MIIDLSKKATQEEFAALVGVSQGAIQKRVAAGKLPHGGTLGQWLEAYIAGLREAAARRGSDDDDRKRRDRAQAELLEMKAATQRGELIDRASYERASFQTARVLRDALVETLPSRLAPELAAVTEPWPLECRLRDAIRAELHAICNTLTDDSRDWSGNQ